MSGKSYLASLALLAAGLPLSLHAAATITIVNGDPAGVGFNDATAVAPVGGNAGVTLGQQRLIAFQEAANIWGAQLTSSVTIRVLATWEALSCTANTAVLGSAGTLEVFSDFTGAPFAGTWYGKALTAKLSGADPDAATADIRARFNINLGNTGCLTGIPFYLGIDNNHGAAVDLVTVLLHEFAHGLGFQTFTSGTTGAFLAGQPSVYDRFALDVSTNKTWNIMTDTERVASAVNTQKLVWTGANVTANSSQMLVGGVPRLSVTAPAASAANYLVGPAAFGPALSSPGISAELMQVVDTPGNLGLACSPLSFANALAVNGKVALVDRGTCGFTVKVKNAQNAGALAVIVADNAAGSPPAGLGGSDATITIPAVRVTQADGATLKAQMARRTRTHSGVFVTLGLDNAAVNGADSQGRVFLFTPNPFQQGSSVSHYDISAFHNLLMEPAINPDLTHSVTTPQDLTKQLLLDIGWN